ncbi:MAG: hypothetical protein JSR51_07150 [Proteobacteria bacterium]|nr:hypothetical protein [Pseudomonadota bacterium]
MNDTLDSRHKNPRILSEKFLVQLYKHVINIMCLDSGQNALKENSGKCAVYNFSAFVVEINDRWFAISAGHIFRELKLAVSHGAKLSNWQIDDSIVSSKPQPACPISIDLDKDVYSLCDEVKGMDYAYIELDFLTKLALSKEGIAAIPQSVWSAKDLEEFSLWLLIGTPTALAKLVFEEPIVKNYATIQLERVNNVPHGLCNTKYPRLYAKIYFESVIEAKHGFDIGGMSGGPIFGLRPFTDSTPYEYRLIGIQSAWNGKDSVALCPAFPYIQVIANHLSLANGSISN